MGSPKGATVYCGAAHWACTVEWHGYVLRAGAVAVGSGKDAAVPNMGLEIMAIGVVGHGARHAVAVNGWGGGRPV